MLKYNGEVVPNQIFVKKVLELQINQRMSTKQSNV